MIPEGLQRRLHALRRILRQLIITAGVARVFLIMAGLTAFCFLADWQFRLPPGWRLCLGLFSLVAAAAALHRFLIRPLRVPMPDDQLALLFERRFPELSDLFVSAVQLAGGSPLASSRMIEAVLRDADRAAGRVEPRRVPKLRAVNGLAMAAVGAAAVLAASALARPENANLFLARYLRPFGAADWPRDTELVLEVAGLRAREISVPRGEQVAVTVTARNVRGAKFWAPPRTVWLEYESAAGEKNARPMRRIEDRLYQGYFNDVAEDLVIRARAGDVTTPDVRIRVVELPRIEDVWISLEYPKYTSRAAEPPSRAMTEVVALVGTKVNVEVRTNTKLPPEGARMVIDPAGAVGMRDTGGNGTAGATHRGEFVLAAGMKWFRIELTDAGGLRNRPSRTFQLQPLDDKPPRVKIAKPGGQTRCTPYALVPLEVSVKDDLGVRSAWLRYARGPKEAAETRPFELKEKAPKDATIAYRWDLSELGLKVGQTLTYRAEADDFRDLFPPGAKETRQVGASEDYFIEIVSPTDLASELDHQLFALRDEVKRNKVRQEEDRRKVGELLRKMAEGQALTNDDRAMTADAENVQRELGRAVERVGAEVGRVRERMQDNRIGSFEDRRRLDDVKGALESVALSDMPRAADFIKSARKDLTSREGRDCLITASGVQDGIVRKLDKVLAEMSHNEDIDNLVRAARDLLRKEQGIRSDTGDFAKRPGTFGASPNDLQPADLGALNLLVRNQTAARDNMRSLEQDMLNVFERLKEPDPRRAEIVRQAQLQAGRDQVRAMMEEAAAKLAVNQCGLAASNQDTVIKGLERLLELLESARQDSGSDEAVNRALQDVRTALQAVQRLHKEQQGNAGDASEINRNAEQVKRLKQLRRQIENLRKSQDEANAAADDAAKLKALADAEEKLVREAEGLAGEVEKERRDADERRAPQAGSIRDAAAAMAGAKDKMNAAKTAMQQGNASGARAGGQQASGELGKAAQALADAIDAMEKKRLDATRETAIKQGETEKQAERVLRDLKQLAKENEDVSKEASEGLDKAGGKVGEAGQSMRSAHANLDRNDSVQGEQDAKTARDRLADAQKILEDLRDRLDAKQKKQKILDLIVEIQPMLDKQIEINDETRRIDTATAEAKLPEPSRPDQVRLGQLGADESRLASKAGELLKRVEGENAPVFVWGFEKVAKDMNEAKERLLAFQTDSYTQDVEKDIADTLRMLIDALKREQTRMREGGGGGGGGGGKPMLVPPSAQLKLLRARELEIHNNTKRIELKRLVRADKTLSVLDEKRVRNLGEEQAKLGELTTKLAEALERELEQSSGAPGPR